MSQYLFTYRSDGVSEDCLHDDLDRVISENGLAPETGRRLRLAVSEAFTNARIHGNRCRADKFIKIKLRVDETDIIADITDQGSGGLRRINNRQPQSLLAENGRGIGLIQHCASDAEFREDEMGGLVVTIRLGCMTKVETS